MVEIARLEECLARIKEYAKAGKQVPVDDVEYVDVAVLRLARRVEKAEHDREAAHQANVMATREKLNMTEENKRLTRELARFQAERAQYEYRLADRKAHDEQVGELVQRCRRSYWRSIGDGYRQAELDSGGRKGVRRRNGNGDFAT